MIPYKPQEFRIGEGFRHDGLWLRYGIVQTIDTNKGLVTLEWLDHPGVRTEVPVSQPSLGILEMPPIGAVVLVAFDQGYKAQIVRYLPVGYAKQVIDGDIRGIKSGEKMFVSYSAISQQTESFPVPTLTGTLFHMNNVGDIELATASGERWFMDNRQNEINQNSMNYRVQTEAGILDFGLTKRLLSAEDSTTPPVIIDTDGNAFNKSIQTNPEALTEFRLRILDKADADFTTDPEIDDPFIEFTLGVKVDNDGAIVETNSDHFTANKEIVMQLKTKTGQGFEFTVDRDGNLTLKTGGSIKIASDNNLEIDVGGNADISVAGTINVDAAEVNLTGSKAVVLENFIDQFENHVHITSMGPSDKPTLPIFRNTALSKKVKVS